MLLSVAGTALASREQPLPRLTQCHKCHGYGHIASQCPSGQKGKGKGKADRPVYESGYGKAKGKGWGQPVKGGMGKGGPVGKAKGKGKNPPRDGCFTCGGPHWAAECPNVGKAAGKAADKAEEQQRRKSTHHRQRQEGAERSGHWVGQRGLSAA